MHVSVIISNFNGARYLPKLLATLRGQQHVELEIIVVDRDSSDESHAILTSCDDITLLQHPPGTGLVSGYHVGAARASHDLLFFCNEDMWFDERCLEQPAARIDIGNGIIASDPWHWNCHDTARWLHGGVRFVKAAFSPVTAYPFRRVDFTVDLSPDDEVPFPCAGAVMMHRSAYFGLGGWDTSFFLDHEDVDLFLRAWQRGLRVVTVPDAKVFHDVGASNAKALPSAQRVSERRWVSHNANMIQICLKYFSGTHMVWAVLHLARLFAFSIVRMRFREVSFAFRCLLEVAGRIPAAVRFRRLNREYNRWLSGERFFCDGRFQSRQGL